MITPGKIIHRQHIKSSFYWLPPVPSTNPPRYPETTAANKNQ